MTTTINGIEITEELVEILKGLGLGEKTCSEDKITRYVTNTMCKAIDFMIDSLTDCGNLNGDVAKKIVDLLVDTKAARDEIMKLDMEFDKILKL